MYPEAQLCTLHRLASAFGHQWANSTLEELLAAPDRASITLLSERFDSGPLCGILWPGDPDEAGVVTHTTGSGRLMWAVTSEGAANLKVFTPWGEREVWTKSPEDKQRGKQVLEAEVSAGGNAQVLGASNPWKPRFNSRHVAALQEALAALIPWSEAQGMLETQMEEGLEQDGYDLITDVSEVLDTAAHILIRNRTHRPLLERREQLARIQADLQRLSRLLDAEEVREAGPSF